MPKNIWQNRLSFTDCFLTKFPPKFPVKSADFSKNLPLKIFQIWIFSTKIREIGWFFCQFWLFSCENPAKAADFSANLPLKIPRNFAFFSAKYQKPCICLTSLLKLFQFGNQTLSNSIKLNRTIQFDKFGNGISPNQKMCVRFQLRLIPNSISIEVNQIF